MFLTNRNKLIGAGLCVAFMLVLLPNANAQRWDRATRITVNQPFQVPGTALPAGEYVLRLMDVASSRTVVQVLNADETKSYAIVLGIPDYRLETPEDAVVTFYEAQPGVPVPMHAWFYPGYNHGVEFVYPKSKAIEIAAASGEHVIATPETEPYTYPTPEELESEPIFAIQPGGEEAEIAAVHPETEEPLAEAQPAPEPVYTAQELPKTATPFPLMALAGLLAAGAAGAIRVVRRRLS